MVIQEEEVVRWLREGPAGIREWNKRRRRGEDVPDLSGISLVGCVLFGADFSGMRLCGTDFRGCLLNDVIFNGADLRNATLAETMLHYAEFTGADLTEADFTQAFLFHCTLFDCRMIRTDFSFARIRECDFGGNLVKGPFLDGTESWREDWSHTLEALDLEASI